MSGKIEITLETVRNELETVRNELRADISDLRGDFNSLRGEFNSLRTWVAGLFLGSIAAMVGLVIVGINAMQAIAS